MKVPEWKKALQDTILTNIMNVNAEMSNHKNDGKNDKDTGGDIHRAIYVSTVSPANQDGENGDIWITYEA